jgi:phospholipid/cholesterol/gamma-HCH transport system substrate-binding protein
MFSTLRRLAVPLVLVALLTAAAVTMLGDEDRKSLVAHFPRTISVYEGSDVRILGVPVGQVESVTPSGTDVAVRMSYDAGVEVPAEAQAVIIAPSVVGDRYIQLTPAYTGGEALADGAELAGEDTSVPLELDQIYSSLNDLNVALGPNGANSEGALSDLMVETAENYAGQGEAFNQTVKDFSQLSSTLENNKEELFGATRQLEAFVSTLAENDGTVRQFNQSLARVSTLLAGEREELAASLENLGTALGEVNRFVRDNRAVLGRNISGLNRVTDILVRQRDALDEILHVAPLALNNLTMTYNPQTGTLDTRSNGGHLFDQLEEDPSLYLCTQLNELDEQGELCNAVRQALGPRSRAAAFGQRPAEEPEKFDPTLAGLVEVQP